MDADRRDLVVMPDVVGLEVRRAYRVAAEAGVALAQPAPPAAERPEAAGG